LGSSPEDSPSRITIKRKHFIHRGEGEALPLPIQSVLQCYKESSSQRHYKAPVTIKKLSKKELVLESVNDAVEKKDATLEMKRLK
jgi:hypothetical protein